jgi:arginine decarboxylase
MKNEPSTVWSPSSPQAAPLNNGTPPLVQALITYDHLQRRRYHVPAHAGFNLLPPELDLVRDPYRYDLSELEGLDVLSEPFESILEAQAQVASLFGVAQSYFLINGASVGLMTALLSTVKPGDTVLLPRNAHRSVLSGLILTGAKPVWFLPERLPEWGLWGSVTPEQVLAQLEAHPEAKALFITSPTYEGLGSDVAALAKLCRARGVYLVVDEAHGGLWPFSQQLPTSATQLGADAVIHSMHKSGGSLTQSALAHLPLGSRIDPAMFQQCLNTLQTTSPSYLLLASLEASCHALASQDGQRRVAALMAQTQALRAELGAKLKNFCLFEALGRQAELCDPCKLYLIHPHESGADWGARLEAEQQLAYESASPDGVLYLANLGLQPEDFEALKTALLHEDKTHGRERATQASLHDALAPKSPMILLPEMVMLPRDAFFAHGEQVSPERAVGRIAKETIVHCPPGIPVLFPGERVLPAHLPFLPKPGVLVVSDVTS